MPKKITGFNELINSVRFKRAMKRSLNDGELSKINELFNHINNTTNDLFSNSGTYSIFLALISHDLEDLPKRFDFLKSNNTARSKETYCARYGNIEGLKRWTLYVEKQRYKNTFESKQEKHGWTLDQFNKFNKSRAVTYELCVKRHGVEKGVQIWNDYCDRQKYTNSVEYYIEKYGENIGYDQWKLYNLEKGKSSRLDWIIEKYSVTEEDALEILSNRLPKSSSSEAELRFIDMLEKELNECIKYTAKTKQFCIWNPYTNSPNFYDVACTDRKKIIEFHGDYWHCNPMKYSPDYLHPVSNKLAKEIWKKDDLKRQAAIDRGFEIKVIWWSEFENDYKITIKECVKWLNQI